MFEIFLLNHCLAAEKTTQVNSGLKTRVDTELSLITTLACGKGGLNPPFTPTPPFLGGSRPFWSKNKQYFRDLPGSKQLGIHYPLLFSRPLPYRTPFPLSPFTYITSSTHEFWRVPRDPKRVKSCGLVVRALDW